MDWDRKIGVSVGLGDSSRITKPSTGERCHQLTGWQLKMISHAQTKNEDTFDLMQLVHGLAAGVRSFFEPTSEEIQETESAMYAALWSIAGPLLSVSDDRFHKLLLSYAAAPGKFDELRKLVKSDAGRIIVERAEQNEKVRSLKPPPPPADPFAAQLADLLMDRADHLHALMKKRSNMGGFQRPPAADVAREKRLFLAPFMSVLVAAGGNSTRYPAHNVQRAYDACGVHLTKLGHLFKISDDQMISPMEFKLAEEAEAKLEAEIKRTNEQLSRIREEDAVGALLGD